MTYHWKEEEFIEYLDRRVPPNARLEAHLADCPDCRRRLEELRALRSILDEWIPAPVSSGFEIRLRARLAQEQPATRGWFALRPAFALGLAAAAALAVAVMLWQPPAPEPVQVKQQTSAPTAPGAPQALPNASAASATDAEALALLDNPELLNDYELLEKFDVLFESLDKENGRRL